MKTVNIVAEIPAYLREAIAQLPGSTGKSESDVIAEALRDYIDANVPRLRELKAAVSESGPGASS